MIACLSSARRSAMLTIAMAVTKKEEVPSHKGESAEVSFTHIIPTREPEKHLKSTPTLKITSSQFLEILRYSPSHTNKFKDVSYFPQRS